MLYPHEREERKLLLAGFIDGIHDSKKPLGILTLIFGIFLIAVALLNSFYIVSFDNLLIWIGYWVGLLALSGILAFIVYPLLRRDKRTLLGKPQRFLLFSLLPYYLTGAVIGILLSQGSSNQLATTSLIWSMSHAMALLSLRAYADGSLKNLAAAAIIIPVSLTVVLQRHSELTINPYHLANILLILGIGIPHTIYGMWMVLIKNR